MYLQFSNRKKKTILTLLYNSLHQFHNKFLETTADKNIKLTKISWVPNKGKHIKKIFQYN